MQDTRCPAVLPAHQRGGRRRDAVPVVPPGSRRLPPHCSPDQRRHVLTVDAARYGAWTLRDRLVSSPDTNPSRWRPQWATGVQVNTALRATFTGHTGSVAAVACTVLEGRPVAVTAGADATVRLWDLATSTPIGDPLTGHTSSVAAVACTVLEGRPVAVTGGLDADGAGLGPGRRYPDRGPAHRPHHWVVAVACTVLEGRPVAVTAGAEPRCGSGTWPPVPRSGTRSPATPTRWRRWRAPCWRVDLSRSPAAGMARCGSGTWPLVRRSGTRSPATRWVEAVACTVLEGRPVAVTAGADATVRVWDLATGTPIGDPLTGHTGSVEAVACTVLEGRPVAVTAGGDYAVRIWDLAAGTPIGPERAPPHRVSITHVCSVLSVDHGEGRPAGSVDRPARTSCPTISGVLLVSRSVECRGLGIGEQA